jgi:nicotinamidase-related amidase
MRSALLVIDVQRGFDDAEYWSPTARRNNPHCDENIAALIGAWQGPRVYVRHDSDDRLGPDGTLMTADELARATATSLHGEFATVVRTRALLDP